MSFFPGRKLAEFWINGRHNTAQIQHCSISKVAFKLFFKPVVSGRLAHGRWFSPASSTTKTGRHDIVEILLKVALKHQKSNQFKVFLNTWKLKSN
jgi:hypothetical protein